MTHVYVHQIGPDQHGFLASAARRSSRVSRPTAGARARLCFNQGMAASSPSKLKVGGESYDIFRIDAIGGVQRLPYTLRVLLENVLRTAGERDVDAVAGWIAKDEPSREINFSPARALHQDFTGVPSIVDLAAMRSAMAEFGGDAAKINPLIPAELVIDHSVQVDAFASRLAFGRNVELEFERNRERYAFLRWGQGAFSDLKVVPPGTGIVHQVNLEYLGRVVEERNGVAFPDTLVGTDSHTTMINGLGVLGWGVGGIEAEAAMLGEPLSMLVPQVVGFRLHGSLPEGATATDLVLTVTQLLRRTGVVGKFVEYFGEGLASLPVADRATLGNMSPEYGATCGFFPVDDQTLAYLRLTGREAQRIELVEAYCKENLLWHDAAEQADYSQIVELDLSTVEPSLAGPRRPQDRVPLARAKESFLEALRTFGVEYGNGGHDQAVADTFPASDPTAEQAPGAAEVERGRRAGRRGGAPSTAGSACAEASYELDHGSVVIAAITICTNTSNPQVMVAAGLVAKRAVELGLQRRPWVKSSLAPGSKVVTEYYEKAGLDRYLDSSGSTPSATAARRASETPARCPRRSPRRSPRVTSSSARCSPATGTSRRGSIPRSRRTTSRRRRSSSRTRSRAGWTSICSRSRSGKGTTAPTSTCTTSGRARRRSTR